MKKEKDSNLSINYDYMLGSLMQPTCGYKLFTSQAAHFQLNKVPSVFAGLDINMIKTGYKKFILPLKTKIHSQPIR